MHPLKFVRLAAVAPLAVAALASCSEEARESITTDLDEAADDVEDAGRTAITEVGDAADDVGRDAAELAARNLAAERGEEQFADADRPLDGGLSCEATATEELDAIEISCTGTTEDGEDATMEGTTNELPGASVTELEGTFTGMVAGEEVFSVDALGR